MNKIYRTVWSDTLRTWVAVAENARAKGKSGGARVGASAAVLLGASLVAAPSFAAGMHDIPDLLNGRLTAAPLVGSMTAALNQAGQIPQTVQVATAAPAVLQSATVSAMNGVVPMLNAPLMDTPMASPSMSQIPAVITPVPSLQNTVQTLKAPVAAVTAPLAGATPTAAPAVVATVTQPVRTAVTTTAARTAPVARTAQAPVAAVTGPIVGGAAAPVVSEPLATLSTAVPKLLSTVVTQSGGSNPASGLPTLVNAAIAPVSRVVTPSSNGTPSISLVTDTLDTVVAPVAALVPPLAGTPSSPLAPVTDAVEPVTAALTTVTTPVATATTPVLNAVTGALEPVTTALAPVTTPLAPITNGVGVIAAPVTNALGGITTPLAALPVIGNVVSPMIAPTPVVSGSIAPPLNPEPPSGLVIGTAGVTGGVGQGLAPLTLAAFGQQETFLRSGALAVNRENINARFSVVNVLGLPVLDLAPVTGTLAGTTGGTLPQQNLTLLGGVTSGNYITNINSGLTYNNGLLLPGTTPPSYVQGNNCLNVLGIAGATCWDIPAAQNNQVLIGDGASANGSQEVVIGTNARHLLPNENANDIFTDPNMLGVPNTNYAARKGHSVVIGDNTLGTANGQTIIGAEATSNVAGGVALGFQSVADRVGTGVEAYSGLAVPVQGVVSVGSAGAERQITNVAGGTVDTDAVNLRQLRALETQINVGDANSVKYDDVTKGTATLAGVGGTTLTNLKAGAVSATSTDAVNGSQLNATNQNVTTVTNTVTTLGDTVNTIDLQGTRFFRANSTLAGASATGIDSVAAGGASTASATNSVALGTGANATQANSVALGAGAGTTVGAQTNYAAFGLAAPQSSAGEVSIGSAGAERKLTNVAAGSADTDATNVAQLRAVSSQVGDLDALAVKYDDASRSQLTLNAGGTSTRISNVAAGTLSATSTDAVNGAQLDATNQNVTTVTNTVTTLGDTINTIDLQGTRYFRANTTLAGAAATGADSVAAGGASTASAANSVALGTNAAATQANSVALGAGSTTSVGAQTGYTAVALAAPQTSAGEVSIGSAGAERKLTNVAAGSVDTDAANIAQLRAVGSQVTQLDKLAVKYDDATKTVLTLNAGGGSTRITNLSRGAETAASTDAVNGSQLWGWTQDTTNVLSNTSLYNSIQNINTSGGSPYFRANSTLAGAQATGIDSTAAGPQAVAAGANSVATGKSANAAADNSIATGNAAAATGTAAVAVGSNSTASGAQSTALGADAKATASNSVALGSGSVADRSNSVSVGAVGAERQITNVADGVADTDAANVRQVKAISGDVTNVIAGKDGMFQVENSLARAKPAATGADSVAGGAGALSAGAQATALGNAANAAGSNATAVGNGAVASGTNTASLGQGAVASGANASSFGQAAVASGTNSVAVGNNAQAQASGSMALGNGTQVASAATNSVAIGTSSVASRDNSVSVGGGATGDRQITNVRAGTQGTDAVNVQQLRDATSGFGDDLNNLRGDLRKYERNSYAGAASAMAVAGLPSAYQPGKSMASAAVSNYLGQSAVAIGVSTITDNGRWVYKFAGNVNSQGKLGAVVGAGYQF